MTENQNDKTKLTSVDEVLPTAAGYTRFIMVGWARVSVGHYNIPNRKLHNKKNLEARKRYGAKRYNIARKLVTLNRTSSDQGSLGNTIKH